MKRADVSQNNRQARFIHVFYKLVLTDVKTNYEEINYVSMVIHFFEGLYFVEIKTTLIYRK